MNKNFGCTLFLACCFFIFDIVPSRSLDMNVAVNAEEKLIYVNMWGAIEGGDDEKFKDLIVPYLRSGHLVFQVNIFSQGGHVPAAMRIGDQIRLLQTRTVTAYNEARIIDNQRVQTNDALCGFWEGKGGYVNWSPVRGYNWCTCESACFLIWASGITRQGGRIGVHRFYYKGTEFGNLPAQKAREIYQNAQTEFRAYVTKLDVPVTIIDRLFATDRYNMHFLTWPEIQLLDNTPYLEEMVHSKCGKSKHISMSAANNWTSTEDPVHVACYRTILKQLMREGTNNYLASLGESAPTFVEKPFDPAAPTIPNVGGTKHWNQNGSSFKLEATKAKRRFVFIEPREGLKEVGVREGMVAFDGRRNGSTYEGTAYVFSVRCGAVGFAVKGEVSPDDRSVTLKGHAPYVDANCKRSGGRDSILTYELVEN